MSDDRGLWFGEKLTEAATADFANNRAYVIGINAYQNGIPPLRTAVADAERLGQLLEESHGYKTLAYPRDSAPSLANLRNLLREKMPQEIGPNDRVLFYFAGHGIALDGEDGPEGYLVPEDANREDRTSFLSMTELNDALAQLPCRHLLLILDCCFAGAFRWSSTRDLTALPNVIHRERYERYIQDPAWQVLTSAAYDQKALDVLSGNTIGERIETTEHSPFAAALFRALKGDADLIPRGKDGQPSGDGVITATELYLYLRECVETATEAHSTRQTPGLWPLKKHDKGEYVLLTPGHELNLPPAPELNEANNPYRGLQSFDEEHAPLFFGRSKFVAALAERVQAQSLTIVLGASGTGKSSVVKAGLLPFLRFRETDAWHIVPPLRPGKSPLAALAALTLPGESSDPGAIADRLKAASSNAESLAYRVGYWAVGTSPSALLLIVVDQFEELLTLCWDTAEREQFLMQLDRALAACPDRLRLVLTLRSDFEPQFAHSPLQEEWLAARIVVPVMALDEYREAIEGPASVKVLYFQGKASSQAFIDRLIGDVANTPGALPLLSFTLSELYRRYLARGGDDRSLREEDYEALGGVGGSLRNRADEAYAGLPDEAHRETMKRVMLRMVAVEGGELARHRVPDAELIYRDSDENQRVKEVLDTLLNARLIVKGKEPDGEPYVEPAHDALVRGWDKLLEWTQESQEQLTLRRLLTPAANDWKKGTGGLWHFNPRLLLLRQQLGSSQDYDESSSRRRDDGWLNVAESEFVERSVQRRQNTFASIIGSVAAALIGLTTLTILAMIERNRAETNAAQARHQTSEVVTRESLRHERDGNVFAAMHGYGQAVNLVTQDPSLQRDNRIRLRLRLDSTPILSDIRNYGAGTFNSQGDRYVVPGDTRSPRPQPEPSIVSDDDTLPPIFDDFLEKMIHTEKVATLWDVWDGRPIALLAGHTRPIRELIFSERGDRLATTAGDDFTALELRVWDTRDGRLILVPDGLKGKLHSVKSDLEGRLLAVLLVNDEHDVLVYDSATGELRFPLDGHDALVEDVAFGPGNRRLVTLVSDGTARVWDGENGRLLQTVLSSQGHDFRKLEISSPAGHQVLITSPSGDQRLVCELETGRILDMAVEEDEASPIGPDPDTTIGRDPDSTVARSLDGRRRLDVSRNDQSSLLRLPENDRLTLWSLPEERLMATVQGHGDRIRSAAFDGDRSIRWAVACNDGTLRLWNSAETKPALLLAEGGDVFRHHDGLLWYRTTPDDNDVGIVRVRDLATGRLLEVLDSLPTDADASRLFVKIGDLYRHEGSVKRTATTVRERATDRVLSALDASIGADKNIQFSHDDRLVLVCDDNANRIFETRTGRFVSQLARHHQHVMGSEFDASGTRVLTWAGDAVARVCDVSTGKALALCVGHGADITHAGLSPDGRLVVTTSEDHTARLWDARTGRTVHTLAGHTAEVNHAAFAPDGRMVATACEDGSVRLWDVTSGSLLDSLAGTYGSAKWVRFSRDGGTILVGSRDDQVACWGVAPTQIPADVLPPWIEAITGTTADPAVITGVRPLTIEQWSRRHREATLALVAALRTAESDRRVELMAALFRLKPDRSLARNLIQASQSGTLTARVTAATALLTIDPAAREAGNGILDEYRENPLHFPRSLSVRVLSRVDSEALPKLIEQLAVELKSADTATRREIVDALGETQAVERALAVLASTLKDHDLVVRRLAILAIHRQASRSGALTTFLAEALNDEDELVRRHAAGILVVAGAGSAEVARALIAAAQQGRLGKDTAEVLVKLGHRAIPALIDALSTQDEAVRDAVSWALGRMGPDAVPGLLGAVRADDLNKRLGAVHALAKIEPAPRIAVPVLIESLGESEIELRTGALHALSSIGEDALPAIVAALKHPNSKVRYHAAEFLSIHGESLTALVPDSSAAQLQRGENPSDNTTDSGDDGRLQAIIMALVEAVQDSEASVRKKAAEALYAIARERAVSVLVPGLKDPEPKVRRNAIDALEPIGNLAADDMEAIEDLVVNEPLYSILENDPEQALRARAAFVIGRIGVEGPPIFRKPNLEAIPALIRAMWDTSSEEVRLSAASAIHNMLTANRFLETDRPEVAAADSAMDAALDDADPDLRWLAADTLAWIRDDPGRVIPVLSDLLAENTGEKTLIKSAETLGRLGDKAAQAAGLLSKCLGHPQVHVRLAAARAMTQIGPVNPLLVQTLVAALDSEDPAIKVEAALTLWTIAPQARQAAPSLLKVVEGTNRLVRVYSAGALVAIEPRHPLARSVLAESIPLLIEVFETASDPRHRVFAAKSLGYLGKDAQAALSALRNAEVDPDWDVKSAASEALETIQSEASITQ